MKFVPDTKRIFIFRMKHYTIIRGRSKHRTFDTCLESTNESDIRKAKRHMKSLIRRDNKCKD